MSKYSFYGLIACEIIILLFVTGCTPKNEANSNKVISISNDYDSIAYWIQEGKKRNNSIPDRLAYYNRAAENIESIGPDSLKIKLFSKVSLGYLRLNDTLKFRHLNRKTTELAKKLKDSVVLAEAHWDLAEFFRNSTVKDSAYYHYAEAQNLYAHLKDNRNTGQMLYNMALTQEAVKDHMGSEINTVRAIELLKPLNKNLELYRCYNLLGIAAKNLGEFDNALKYYNEALGYLDEIGAKTTNRGLLVLNNIGGVYQAQTNYQKAVATFKNIVQDDSLYFKNPKLYARSLDNLAYNQFKLGHTAGVENRLKYALYVRDSINDIVGVSKSHYSLAAYYLGQKDTLQARLQALKAKKFASESSNNERLLETLKLLAHLYPKNAIGHTEEYIALNDSLHKAERKIRNKFARIRFETDEFIAENQLLARQKQLLSGISISLLLLGIAILIIVNQLVKNQKLKIERQQQVSNERIFNLMLSEKQKFEEGKQLEQKRISEELHDGVLGKMLGARLVLTGLNKKIDHEAVGERAEAIAALKDIEGEVRSISHDLSHTAYQKINNFIRSIKDLLENSEVTANFAHSFNYDENVDWDGLSGTIKINLYRIVQETLQNAIKHAQCKNLTIDFASDGDFLQIAIEDDGVGFDFRKKRKGIGLRNITSRIDKIDGTCSINSEPGKGTSMIIRIPIDYFSEKSLIFDELSVSNKA